MQQAPSAKLIEDLQQEVADLRRQNAELARLPSDTRLEEAEGLMQSDAARLGASECRELQRRLIELERENALLASAKELAEQPLHGAEEPTAEAGVVEQVSPVREGADATVARVEELVRCLRASEEELSKERLRSEQLRSDADSARAGKLVDAASVVELQTLRRRVQELEKPSVDRTLGVSSPLGSESIVTRAEDPYRRLESIEEAFEMECIRAERLNDEVEQLKAELIEDRVRLVPTSTSGLESGSGAGVPQGALDSDVGWASGAGGAAESPEVRALRSELAKRDRRLLAAAAAQRRSADQSERVASGLRARLAELEALVAATPTPSASSRASSPPRSEEAGGSPFLSAATRPPAADQAVQTEQPLYASAELGAPGAPGAPGPVEQPADRATARRPAASRAEHVRGAGGGGLVAQAAAAPPPRREEAEELAAAAALHHSPRWW